MRQTAPDVHTLVADAQRHHNSGQLEEAVACYRRLLLLNPDYAGVHTNLGTALCELGRLDEAEASYRQALAIAPGDPEAHNNLGTLLYQQGRLEEAVARYREAIALKPGHAQAHNNLGTALAALGKPDEAQASYRRALALKPDYVEARIHLGTLYWEQGKLEEAASVYRRALEFAPHYTDALDRLAAVLMLQGKYLPALETLWRSLQIAETENSKRLFVDFVKKAHWTSCDRRIRDTVGRALAEPWARPSELAQAAANLIKLTPGIGEGVTRAAKAWPDYLSAAELYGTGGLAALSDDTLLCGLLGSTQNIDIALERFLTMARRLLLETAAAAPEDAPGMAFHSALARQCFINEYVFFHTEDEIARAARLRDALDQALENRQPVPAAWVTAVAAYFPLFELSQSAQLLAREWPAPVAAIVAQQVAEPLEVRRLRDTMAKLTPVEDAVSQMVRGHYEENPYPRWVRTALAQNPVTMAEYLNRKFPLAPFRRVIASHRPEILCAGCGTGIATIEFSLAIRDAHLQAVDLSLLSLGYAKRKAQELGVTAIDFAQADILRLGALDRRYDVIESSGVLHHMADAFAGWRVLLSLLKPGGFMLTGLYSRLARRDIVRARELIAARGYGVGADAIRRARQELLEVSARDNLGIATANADFFGISTCRDLLFHSQELRLTLDEIAAFLKENNLTFLGFEIEEEVLAAYRKRFPDDPAAIDLENWKAFEADNPATFSAMYMIWIQKPQ